MVGGDTRALPMANAGMQTSKRGACVHCWVCGIRPSAGVMLWMAALCRCERDERQLLLAETQASFVRAPDALKQAVLSPTAPAEKTKEEIVQIGRAAELDDRKHNNSDHKCKAGYHQRDPFTRYYPGWFDPARCFFNCTAHEVGNVMENLFATLGGFDMKRRKVEVALGRIEYIGGNAKADWERAQLSRAEAKKGKDRAKKATGNTHTRAVLPHTLAHYLYCTHTHYFHSQVRVAQVARIPSAPSQMTSAPSQMTTARGKGRHCPGGTAPSSRFV
jgi:hypothetical protein